MATNDFFILGVPRAFTGSDKSYPVKEFWAAFERYVSFKKLSDGQRKPVFRMLLSDGAARFYDQLPAKDSLDDIKKAFLHRYKISTLSRLEQVSRLWNESQDKEDLLDYIDRISSRGSELGLSGEQIRDIVIRGMNPEVRAFILQGNHSSLEDVNARAQVAVECHSVPQAETILKSVADKVKASLESPKESVNVVKDDHGKNVCFTCFYGEDGQQPVEGDTCWECGQTRGTSVYVMDGHHEDYDLCPACGFPDHHNGQCPAEGQICWNCDQVGHFARVCNVDVEESASE